MKHLLTLAALAALPLATLAQATKPTARPAAKPASKPTARPAATPAPKPVAKPTPAPAAPAPANPRPAPAAPAPQPARRMAAGEAAFGVGTNVASLGIGLGNRYTYTGSASPAFSASFERGVAEAGPGVIGVGAFVGYQSASGDVLFFKTSVKALVVAARGTFHYPLANVPQLDVYGGLSLGLYHASVDIEGLASSSANELYLAPLVGGRYYFTPGIGAFAELGYEQSFLKVGLAAKF